MIYTRDPYKNAETAAYVTAVNILAVEYLVKTHNPDEYSRRINQVYTLTEDDFVVLHVYLDLNMHISSLGAMITQGDYEYQREILLDYLDGKR
jgi:hypothetical protein